jgi:hypothetical protein
VSNYFLTIEPLVDGQDWLIPPETFEELPIARDLERVADEYATLAQDKCSETDPAFLGFSVLAPFAAGLAPPTLPFIQFIEAYAATAGVEAGCPYYPWWSRGE